MSCAFEGCERRHYARTWCFAHYMQWLRTGVVHALRPSAVERFWSKVNKTDGCWLWTAGRFKEGYGQFKLLGRTRLAHQVAWEWENGPTPDRHLLHHDCETKHCVRPSHIHPKTRLAHAASHKKA